MVTQEEMEYRLKRATISAANDIIERGLDRYVNDGTRFGFFDVDDEPKKILTNIIDQLIGYEEYELVISLKNKL